MPAAQKIRPESATETDGAHTDAVPAFPCLQGLIAANVALMTAYANPDPRASVGPGAQRRLLARKVVSNLFFLREHPLLSPSLRQVMANAHQLWSQLPDGCGGSDGDGLSWAANTGLTTH